MGFPSLTLDNWFGIIGIVATIIVGVAIFLIQRRANSNVNSIINGVHERETNQKNFWIDLSAKQLQHIKDWYAQILQAYETDLRVGLNANNSSIIKSHLEQAAKHTKESYVPLLEKSITQIADLLLDPSLFSHLTTYKFDKFINPDRYKMDNRHYEDQIHLLRDTIRDIDSFLTRIQKEVTKQQK